MKVFCDKGILNIFVCANDEESLGNVRPDEVSFSEGGMKIYILSDCRGCLTQPASELDLAWSGYVETVERLVVAVDGRMDPLRLNAERAVRQLDTRISDAIMHAMENGPALEEKVSTKEFEHARNLRPTYRVNLLSWLQNAHHS